MLVLNLPFKALMFLTLMRPSLVLFLVLWLKLVKDFLRSEERFSRNAETDLVCRLLLEKKNHSSRTRCRTQRTTLFRRCRPGRARAGPRNGRRRSSYAGCG